MLALLHIERRPLLLQQGVEPPPEAVMMLREELMKETVRYFSEAATAARAIGIMKRYVAERVNA